MKALVIDTILFIIDVTWLRPSQEYLGLEILGGDNLGLQQL